MIIKPSEGFGLKRSNTLKKDLNDDLTALKTARNKPKSKLDMNSSDS
jgi:hypothetical protein